MMVIDPFHLSVLLSAVLVLEPICAFKLDEYEKMLDGSSNNECYKECQESTLFPIDVKKTTVNPIFLKPNPHLVNYIPPKPKNGGRPKIIPITRTFMPRVDPFPYPRKTFLPTATNSYYFSSVGPFFRIWRAQWYTSK